MILNSNKTKEVILKNINLYINNTHEFNKILNNDCIIAGRFVLLHINDITKGDRVSNITNLDMYCNEMQYNNLKLFLMNNNFKFKECLDTDDKMYKTYDKKKHTKRHCFSKTVNFNKLNIIANIVNRPISYINKNIKLNIEKNYYNGSLVVIQYPKNVILKKESIHVGSMKYLNNSNLYEYINLGYKIKLININQLNNYMLVNKAKDNKLNNLKNYFKYIYYRLIYK